MYVCMISLNLLPISGNVTINFNLSSVGKYDII